MTKIPVVFIHFGELPAYAAIVTAHARSFGNEVIMLNPTLDELHAHPFARVYEHLSTNHYDFELACIVRWFWLWDWMVSDLERRIYPTLYLDTDVLLYADATKEWEYYRQFGCTLSLGTSGHTSFWNFAALDRFCRWVKVVYSDKAQTFQELQRIYADMQAQHLAGGVSDMLLLKMFAVSAGVSESSSPIPIHIGEMSVVREGAYYDHNFSSDDGFSMKQGHKRIFMYSGLPYGLHKEHDAPVLFKSLHFQNGAKELIAEYAHKQEAQP